MSVAMARGILFLALLVILPLPFYLSGWLWLTPCYVVLLVLEHWASERVGFEAVSSLVLIVQLSAWLFICAGLAYLYGRCSASWPMKFRGSVMGIAIMTGLILLSTWPVYDGFPVVSAGLSFMELYHH